MIYVARRFNYLLTKTIVFSHALQGVCTLRGAAAGNEGKQRSDPQDRNAHTTASYSLLKPQLVLPVRAFFEVPPCPSALSSPALAEQSGMIHSLVEQHAGKLGMPGLPQSETFAVVQNVAAVHTTC